MNSPNHNEFQQLLRTMLPASVALAVADAGMWKLPALPEEERFIAKAVEKRRRDFRAGRHCARAALAAAGCDGKPAIPVGEMRQPVWPEGFAGSISHSGDTCVAVAARHQDYRSLGIDVESARPLGADLVTMICTPAERKWLQKTEQPLAWAKLLFSIKEAIYKAYFPVYGEFLEFQHAEIVADAGEQSFVARVGKPEAGVAFDAGGCFRRDARRVAAFVAVAANSGNRVALPGVSTVP